MRQILQYMCCSSRPRQAARRSDAPASFVWRCSLQATAQMKPQPQSEEARIYLHADLIAHDSVCTRCRQHKPRFRTGNPPSINPAVLPCMHTHAHKQTRVKGSGSRGGGGGSLGFWTQLSRMVNVAILIEMVHGHGELSFFPFLFLSKHLRCTRRRPRAVPSFSKCRQIIRSLKDCSDRGYLHQINAKHMQQFAYWSLFPPCLVQPLALGKPAYRIPLGPAPRRGSEGDAVH